MMSIDRFFAGLSAGIVCIALVWGFILVGSPVSSRQVRFDERRLEDLRLINQTILNIVHDGRPWDISTDGLLRKPLPESLDRIVAQATGQRVNDTDPQTGERYEYQTTGTATYRLCAIFNAARNEPFDVFWNHEAGRACYSFDALQSEGYAGNALEKPVPMMLD